MKLNHILLAALIGTMSAGCETDVPIDQLDAATNGDICFATGGYFQDGICYCADVADETKYPRDAEGKIRNLDTIPAILKCDKGVACTINYDSGQDDLVCAGKNKKLHDSFAIGVSCQDDIYENLKENMKGFFSLVKSNSLNFNGSLNEFKDSLKSTLLGTVAVPQKCINDEYGNGVVSTCLGAYDLRILEEKWVDFNLQLVKGYLDNYKTITDNSKLSPGQQKNPIEEFRLTDDKGTTKPYKCETEDECINKLNDIYSQVLGGLRKIFTDFKWQEPFQCPMNVSCKQTVRGLGECGVCHNDDKEEAKCRRHPNWVRVTSSHSNLGTYGLVNDSFLGYCKNGEFEITEKCVAGCDKGYPQCHTSEIIKGCSVDDKKCLNKPHRYKYINVKYLTDESNRMKVDGYRSGTTVCIKADDNYYVGKLFIEANNVKKVVYSEQSKCPASEKCNSDWTFCESNILSSNEPYRCKQGSQEYKCVLGHDVTTERHSPIVFVCNSSGGVYSYFDSNGIIRGYQCPEGTFCGKNGSVEENNVCVPK